MNIRVFLRTFGCQANVRDSEWVTGILIDEGYRMVLKAEDADAVIFNSCSVRKHAEERLFGNVCELKDLKARKPDMIIGIMGCTAQSYAEKAFKRTPLIDFVCGPGNEADIGGIIRKIHDDRSRIVAIDKVSAKRPELMPEYRGSGFKALISIGEGCDNFCSYCVVPFVRGRERSRKESDIVKEVMGLAGRGFKEIMLLGQNVNSYGRTTKDERRATKFVGLLESIDKIDGIERVRFMTSHPKDASTELFKAMRDLDKVCEHLHLPLQSGSDKVLKAMNRKYTKKRYLKLVDDYRKFVPGGAITTDIIVGFPGETERDFKETLTVMRKVRFDNAFTFKYSPRPPAKASGLHDDVPPETKQRRLVEVMELQSESSKMQNLRFKGTIVDVLVEDADKRSQDTLLGRTRHNKMTVFKGAKKLIGSTVQVVIDEVKSNALYGRLVDGKKG